MKVCLT